MKFNPYSIHHAPVSLPIWQTILDDLGDPHPKHIAKVLGVGIRTVYRWNREQHAPRVACLALFWLTRWGRSAVDCQAVNDCHMAMDYANAIERELHQTKTQLGHVLALNGTGASNEPIQHFHPSTGVA
jgi:hypothetical protein